MISCVVTGCDNVTVVMAYRLSNNERTVANFPGQWIDYHLRERTVNIAAKLFQRNEPMARRKKPAVNLLKPDTKPAAITGEVRDRIKEFRRVLASSLVPHPRNARLHPNRQAKAVSFLLKTIGNVDVFLVRELEPAGNDEPLLQILDGHLRSSLMPSQMVWVAILDLSAEEAEELIVMLDKTAEMADWNLAMLDKIMPGKGEEFTGYASEMFEIDFTLFAAETEKDSESVISTETVGDIWEAPVAPVKVGLPSGAVAASGSDVGGEAGEGLVAPPEEYQVKDTGIYALREDALFSSGNVWGIPDLIPELLAGEEAIPTGVWLKTDTDTEDRLFIYGSFGKNQPMDGGVVGFYANDEEFEKVWLDTVNATYELLAKNLKAVISPDFSVWRDWPLCLQLWSIYRSRWCSRYWQEAGLKVIPSLNWSDERSYEWAFAGLPIGAEVVSCQCRTTSGELGQEFFMKGLCTAIEYLKPKNVLLYGGSEHYDRFETLLPRANQTNYHFYYSHRTLIGNQRDNQFKRSLHKPGVRQ